MNRREAIIATVSKIDALPAVAVELLGIIQSPDADAGTVARVIEHDPAMAANVLKLANSAAAGARQPIRSIKQAVARIGLRGTAELVLDVVVGPYAGRPIQGYDLPPGALWKHAAAVAIATEVLCDVSGRPAPVEAFTAGLLHDIGKVVLGEFVDVDLESIRTLAFEQGLSFEAAEREVLGIDHAQVGALLLDEWGLGGTLREAVRWHHEPEGAGEDCREVVDLVHACVLIVTASGVGGGADGVQYHTSRESIEHLSLRPEVVEQVLFQTFERLEEICRLNEATTGSQQP